MVSNELLREQTGLKTHSTRFRQLLTNMSKMTNLLIIVAVGNKIRVLIDELSVIFLGHGVLSSELVQRSYEVLVLITNALNLGEFSEGAGGRKDQ